MKTFFAPFQVLILLFGLSPILTTASFAEETKEKALRPLLLDFSATWCGPCRQMRPEIARLKKQGLPIKEIDIDQSPALAARYRITGVPAFLMVDEEGRVLERTEGAQSAQAILSLYRKAQSHLRERAESTDRRPKRDLVRDDDEPRGIDFEDGSAEPRVRDRKRSKNPRPWQTVVRIKVSAPGGMMEYGSGTIVWSTDDEAIILTCAHIFHIEGVAKQPRPERFPYQIMIDLFDGRLAGPRKNTVHPVETLPGKALDYDFAHDVGLIRIKTRRRLASSPVVPTNWQAKPGMNLVAVGCPEGQDATAWSTKILHTRMGNPNAVGSGKPSYEGILCSNAPRQGRSGGGLYTEEGYVAGVCDFADYRNNHGIYAAAESIRRILDRNNLSFVYNGGREGGSERLLAETETGAAERDRRDDEPIYRGQNPSEPPVVKGPSRLITIPKPELLGIPAPRFVSNGVDSEGSRKRGWTQAREAAEAGDAVLAEKAAIRMEADVDPDSAAFGSTDALEERVETPARPPKSERTKSKWRPAGAR